MEFQISNTHEIYKGDFDRMVAVQGLEVFEKSQIDQFLNQLGGILEKSEYDELSEEEKKKEELIKGEINSMNIWSVVDNNFQKSLKFTRPIQVKWGEKEDDLVKGIYLDTELNRGFDRVGQETFCKV